MIGACSMYGERRCTYRVWWRNLKERDYVEDVALDGNVIRVLMVCSMCGLLFL
jgi:hypothetical protein